MDPPRGLKREDPQGSRRKQSCLSFLRLLPTAQGRITESEVFAFHPASKAEPECYLLSICMDPGMAAL